MSKKDAEFNVWTILENVNCNNCQENDYSILKVSNYPGKTKLEEFLNAYSSSSETKLTDQLVRCNRCSLVYVNPRIHSKLTLKGYVDAVDIQHHEQDTYRIKSFKRAIKNLDVITREFNWEGLQNNVLDVGCAGGAFPKAAKDLGYRVVGLEPSRYLAKYGQEKYDIEVYASTMEEFAHRSEKFSVISFWDVLEHVPDPRNSLNLAKQLLQENGFLILNLPMIDTLPARLMGGRWPFYLNVHIYYYERKTIKKLLQETGFEVINMQRYWQTLSLGYILFRAGIRLPKVVRDYLTMPVKYYLGQRTIVARRFTND
jgi:2-polyprenyl-3-methyl-5-hydroxy-6-metoxy-1,4-benzoquinol methylase